MCLYTNMLECSTLFKTGWEKPTSLETIHTQTNTLRVMLKLLQFTSTHTKLHALWRKEDRPVSHKSCGFLQSRIIPTQEWMEIVQLKWKFGPNFPPHSSQLPESLPKTFWTWTAWHYIRVSMLSISTIYVQKCWRPLGTVTTYFWWCTTSVTWNWVWTLHCYICTRYNALQKGQ